MGNYGQSAGINFGNNADRIFTDNYTMYIQNNNSMIFNIDSNDNHTGQKYEWRHNAEGAGGAALMTLGDDGKLGIGTTAPNEKLEVAPDTDVNAIIGNAVVGYNFSNYASFSHYDQRANTGGYALLQSDGGRTHLNSATGESIRFRINNSDKMTLDSAGKVGIGTTSPDQYLHVKSAATDQALKLESTDGNVDATFTDTGGSGIIRFATDTFKFYTDSGYSVNPLNLKGDKVGIGAGSPGAKLDIVSTSDNNTAGIRIGDGTNFCALYTDSGENFIIDPTNDFIVTGSDDIKLECNDDFQMIADDFYFVSGSQSILQIKYDAGGVTNYRGTVGKIWHEATPVAQIKDDTGFIMEDNQGIKSASSVLDQWPLDGGTGKATAQVQGYSKIQNITTAGVDPASVPSFEVKLPTAAVGAEYVIVFGTNQANLSGKSLTLIANGSDVIHSGSATPSSITFAKHTGESIHFIAFEANRWKVLSHT